MNLFLILKMFPFFNSFWLWFGVGTGCSLITTLLKKTITKTISFKGILYSFIFFVLGFSLIWFFFFNKKTIDLQPTKDTIKKIDETIQGEKEIVKQARDIEKEWRQELYQVEREIDILSQMKIQNKDDIQKNKDKQREVEEQIIALTKKITEIQKDMTTQKSNLKDVQKAIEEKKSQIQQLEHRKERVQTDTEKTNLTLQIQNLTEELTQLVIKENEIKNNIAFSEKEIQGLLMDIQILENLMNNLRLTATNLGEFGEYVRKHMDDAETKRKNIEANLEEVKDFVKMIEKKVLTLEDFKTNMHNLLINGEKYILETGWNCKNIFQGIGDIIGNIGSTIIRVKSGGWLTSLANNSSSTTKTTKTTITEEKQGGFKKGSLAVAGLNAASTLWQQKEAFFQKKMEDLSDAITNPDGTLKMVSKEAYNLICKNLDEELEKDKKELEELKTKQANFKNILENAEAMNEILDEAKDKNKKIIKKSSQSEQEFLQEVQKIANLQKTIKVNKTKVDAQIDEKEKLPELKIQIEDKRIEIKEANEERQKLINKKINMKQLEKLRTQRNFNKVNKLYSK